MQQRCLAHGGAHAATTATSSTTLTSRTRSQCEHQRWIIARANSGFGAATSSSTTNNNRNSAATLDKHLPIDRYFDGLRQLHASPDVYVIDDFLDADECADIIARARAKGDMTQSPVVYAGWTNDVESWVSAAASGPAVWMGALTMLLGSAVFGQEPGLGILAEGVTAYAASVGAAYAASVAFVQRKERELGDLRTSTSTTLNGTGRGERALIKKTSALLPGTSWREYEAPTVIRYEVGQKLAPHFDANRGAQVEDANRGGQTLATLLVYLNDVVGVNNGGGGVTRFGRLKGGDDNNDNDDALAVRPAKGRALLFFPANAAGDFDERVEHEGTEANEEKWIVRIWVHQRRVEAPYGLPEVYDDDAYDDDDA